MTESQAAYLDVCCPCCRKYIGSYKQVNGKVWLRVGIINCRVIRAVCECGADFDFDASQKKLEQLVERSKRIKDML